VSTSYSKLENWCLDHRKLATAPVFIFLLVLAKPTLASLLMGALIVLLGELGRTWSSGYIDKNAKLATAGPYRFTRNPLYLFNTVIFIGFCVMAYNPWAAVLGMMAHAVIYHPTMRKEAAHVSGIFGDEYRDWAKVVPMFLPKWTNYPSQGAYSWALVKQHREHKNAAAMLAGVLLFVGIYIVRHS